MAQLLQNPHEARQLFIDSGLMEVQAIALLSNLWTSANDKDKADWDAQQAELAHLQWEADQAELEENACRQQE
ncbi:hypothetical protein EDD15DRAFT_2376330 [Pisolithus albus]|nr:hypothetical protein EDD15DRAFT_2376330 [Pisolithus albus]